MRRKAAEHREERTPVSVKSNPIAACPLTYEISEIARHSTPPRFLLDTASADGASPPPPSRPRAKRTLARCADQLAGLTAIAHRPTPLPSDDSLIRLAHPLAGAAGAVGFAEAGGRDSALETRLAEQGKRARRSR
ncbi:MAG: hypothetical protein E5X76_17245 [Mesorhizobium sp.]|uniref:Hpt domain-containing protein n=1 Tax=Mesorhizobium sp. TaxID=1871066 RepID=UPI00121AC3C8|nr:Hpt domain-containing protein [Mesorhizobium sp.]TIP05421.1 MAG: hypothetical protein E5X72_07485 [Mesorhizobium sp.]TJV70943.1 MAG: hypothetical protein E5X76_17245 [Mesorhizobium sp.]